MTTATKAMGWLLEQDDINTIIDVGSGKGEHANVFRQAGKRVTTVSLIPPADYIGDFMEMEEKEFDAVWAAHVLEHQLNPNAFLRKCYRMLSDNGVLTVTVPPLKHEIVGGHVNLYNAGLLTYQCILAGFDCSEARVERYGYNISLMVRKKPALLPELHMDVGDIEKLAHLFPWPVYQGFNGNK